jgi:hypothetical protein
MGVDGGGGELRQRVRTGGWRQFAARPCGFEQACDLVLAMIGGHGQGHLCPPYDRCDAICCEPPRDHLGALSSLLCEMETRLSISISDFHYRLTNWVHVNDRFSLGLRETHDICSSSKTLRRQAIPDSKNDFRPLNNKFASIKE